MLCVQRKECGRSLFAVELGVHWHFNRKMEEYYVLSNMKFIELLV